jgi:hypothetical protein
MLYLEKATEVAIMHAAGGLNLANTEYAQQGEGGR